MKKISVILADDHALVRKGLISIITINEHITIVDEASTGEEAYEKVVEKEPNVLITDISMPGMSGLALCEKIVGKHPKTNVLVLSMHKEPEYVIKAFESGAKGYLAKDVTDKEFLDAIESVNDGKRYLTDFVTSILANQFAQSSSKSSTENLTSREKEILSKIVSGLSNKQIASDLFISSRTVDTHRTNIMRKLKAANAAELVRIAITERIV